MSVNDIDINALLSKNVKSWMPHKKDCADQPTKLVGTVVRVDRWTSDYPPPPTVPVVELDPDGDDESLWRIVGYGAVLHRELASVRVGDRIGVRYTGMTKNSKPGMQDYPGYRVVIIPTGEPEPELQPELGAPDLDDRPVYDEEAF